MIIGFLISNFWLVFGVLYILGALAYYSFAYPIAYGKPLSEMKASEVYLDFVRIMFWLPLLLSIPIRVVASFIFWIPLKMIAGKKKEE